MCQILKAFLKKLNPIFTMQVKVGPTVHENLKAITVFLIFPVVVK